MIVYRAPLADIRFVLYELLDYEMTVAKLPGYEEATCEVVDQVLLEAGRFCEKTLLPLNGPGDACGCSFDRGTVRTPPGFKEAYRAFVAGGWPGLACDPAYGGQGLPQVLQLVVDELISSTNVSFGTYPGVSMMAYRLLARHGSDEQKRRFLPRLADGSWTATMCLTEPQSGSDLGLIRAQAERRGDGIYEISGGKIFITGGEHDLAENIIHLVLARIRGAPAGTRGLSLFVVPKFLVNPDGSLGERNGVQCTSIEEKMGIRASSTCAMEFSRARGDLVGEPHDGLRIMFTMMNAARLAVGMQGLGLAEAAYQSAVAHARERLQGRSLGGPRIEGRPADPIIVHPDVRRNLLTIRAFNEGCRALALWVGMACDVAARDPQPARREEAEELVSVMTPVIKAFLTDHGFHAANLGLQVFGGYGYIRSFGVEQLVRDARIGQIYEGTNGIQALDLLARKAVQHSGRLLRRFFHPVSRFIEENRRDPDLREFVEPLARAFSLLQQATIRTLQASTRDPQEAGAAATDYLRLFGLVAVGYLWARAAAVASSRLASAGDAFYRAKLSTARFYMSRLLPESLALFEAIKAGAEPIMEMREEWF